MASSDFILEIDGIKGESKVKGFEDKGIDVESFSWGVHNGGTFSVAGGGGAGKADFDNLVFAKTVDKSSPILALSCATGKHISKAVLHVRKAGGEQEEYYTIELTDVLVSSYTPNANTETVHEGFALNYAKIKFDYKPQDKEGKLGGAINFTYDLKARKA